MAKANTAPVRHGRGRRDYGPIRLLLTAVTVLVVSAIAIVGIATWTVSRAVASRAVALEGPIPTIGAYSGAFNVMLVGVDNSPGQNGFGAARDASMNDVDILVHINASHQAGTVISIPRDLVIDQPDCTDPTTHETNPAVSQEPINTAFGRGGLACVVKSAESLTGLQIPYAAEFTFESTIRMADAVGGVSVCLNQAINDPSSGLNLPKGVSVISGRTALAYLRDRHGVGDGSDLARISSQEAYMSSLLRKMVSSGTLTNPVKLYSLADVAANEVTFSTSLADVDTMVGMMLALKSISLQDMTFVQFPNELDPANTNKVIPDTQLASELLARVQHDEPVVLPKHSTGIGATVTGTTTSAATPTATSRKATAKATARATASATPSSASTESAKPIAGLTGQTAAQQTCSVAFSG